ncbi:MAG: hypothetical protein IT306_24085 [Chloroflexi bacterium]|nr:hypothetical protein [Chloroflexota bacterium]
MTVGPGQFPPAEPPQLQGAVESMRDTSSGVELSVRLRNPSNRALHYIADVRATIFDPATRQLRVQLSDQGREPPPGALSVQPQFRVVGPNSEALLTVRLPRTIVKLSSTPSPSGDVTLEEHVIADADSIEVEIGWGDTPYYRDPRDSARGTPPIAAWEQASLRLTYRPGPRRPGRRR